MALIDFILHIDDHLVTIVNQFGGWSYLILFAIIFIETGLVVFPFLPGDSLIFAASAMAANPKYGLDVWLIYVVVALAAIVGDTVNYEIGAWSTRAGEKHSWFNKLINENNRLAAEKFFERHGPTTIVIGRFIPFIRTFVPFISGGSKMHAFMMCYLDSNAETSFPDMGFGSTKYWFNPTPCHHSCCLR